MNLGYRSQPFWISVVLLSLTVARADADSAEDWTRMKSIEPKGHVCCRTDVPLNIDGRLDEAAWTSAAWTDDFVDIEGDRQPKPRLRTRARMLWDDDYFYIAAELEEPHVWGTLTKHDAVIFQDNDFELFLDPNGDNHEYYEFEINALNTGWDLFLPRPYKDGGTAENRWEIPGLRTAVHVDGTLNDPTDRDRGWTIEIAIPWSALREYARTATPPRDGDQWRTNFSRVEWRHEIENGRYRKTLNTREDNWVWSPQGIVDMHRPERWGFVQFSTKSGTAPAFKPDATRSARDGLMEVYHRQKAHDEKEHRWATTIAELEQLTNPPVKIDGRWRLKTTAAGYRVTLEPDADNHLSQALSIRQDSLLRPVQPADELTDVLEAILFKQAAAWNNGDLDGMMDYYWKSDDLTFSSGGKTTRGWTTTKENYKRHYPTRERMGQLTFRAIEVTPLNQTAALVLGRWNLQREPAPIGGNFSLIFRQIDGQWLIVHDHTSLEPEADPGTAPANPTASTSASQGQAEPGSAVGALAEFLAIERTSRPALNEQSFATHSLNRDEVLQAQTMLWKDHAAHLRESRAEEIAARELVDGELRMPFFLKEFGDKPSTGRSLFISLHGGGGAPKSLNDQQWENQKKLYTLDEGIYVAPRAPTNTWDLWHQAHIDRLFSRLIEDLIVLHDVDPDRVYLLGYSAGGDGVFQLAPRMADRWAAAAMMAGHPNETSPLGLRNLPFAIHMGGRDSAYNRNQIAREWEQKLDDLRAADSDGYVHLVRIYEDKGHWMDRADASAIPWMAKFRRNPYPKRIVWKQDDVKHDRFYWLAIPPDQSADRTQVTAELRGQEVDIVAPEIARLIVRLNDELLDLDRPVTVRSGQRILFQGNVPRSIGTLQKTLAERGDPKSIFSAEVIIDLPQDAP